jgi:DNA-directed RNA polymerase specialized sigma24 family protein
MLDFTKDVLPKVQRYAKAQFRDSDRVADAVSEAWVLLQKDNPNATAGSIAWIAVRRVNCQVHFAQSAQSCDGPNPRNVTAKPARVGFESGFMPGGDDDPAELASLRIDFEDWISKLNARRMAVLMGCLSGERQQETAKRMGLTIQSVSYHLQQLQADWLSFTS